MATAGASIAELGATRAIFWGLMLLGVQFPHTATSREVIRVATESAQPSRLTAGDWIASDRQCWRTVSGSWPETPLSSSAAVACAKSFIEAANHNTQANRPEQYSTIAERFDYYDLLSFVLMRDPLGPEALRGVRFFIGAAIVTTSPGIGAAEDTSEPNFMFGTDAKKALNTVNESLFAKNMIVLKQLMFERKSLFDPIAGSYTLAGADDPALCFDLQMVRYEQSHVTTKLADLSLSPVAKNQINDALSSYLGFGAEWPWPLNLAPRHFGQALAALIQQDLV
jgi:hypothetical protein